MTELPSEIVPLEAVAPHPNILVYARSGTGKTVFAGSDDSVLILNTEPEGEVSARNLGSKAKQWKIHSSKDLDKVYDWAMSLVESGKRIPFKWFCFDSLTTYQRIDMDELLEEGVAIKSAKDPFVPEIKDYLKNQRRIVRRIKEFNQLPVNMLYTCLTMDKVDTEGNEFVFPQIHGKDYEVAEQVCASMTSFGYLFTKPKTKVVDGQRKRIAGIDRYIQWETMRNVPGKDRTLALAPYTKLPERDALKYIRERMEKAAAQHNSANGTVKIEGKK